MNGRMPLRRGLLAGMAALIMCILTGCSEIEQMMPHPGDDWVPEETALVVNRDGTITETIFDSLEEAYYDSAELQKMVNDTTAEYQASHSETALTVDEMTVENGAVFLQMTYQGWEDYASYNQVPFYNGSMLGAQVEGFLFYNEFRRVEEGISSADTITNEEPLSHKECQVLVTDASHMVKVPGKIRYISANADVTDWYFAKPREEAFKTDTQGLVLPSSAVYVDPESKKEVSQTDLEKTYIYVIYEF